MKKKKLGRVLSEGACENELRVVVERSANETETETDGRTNGRTLCAGGPRAASARHGGRVVVDLAARQQGAAEQVQRHGVGELFETRRIRDARRVPRTVW